MIFNLNYTFALSPTAPGSGFSLALTEGDILNSNFDKTTNSNIQDKEWWSAFAVSTVFGAISAHKAFAIGAKENFSNNFYYK